ncbi:MAG: DUF433 domain-containing protein [SAR202 cluster bacterium]|jgi:uncharacterized protein (DUF433 family)|nr:hypothetical protein [Chloroflexota bacterium]MDP6422945.1 DUF433 domain-containing protein [SAR202 cluster bacterium]HAL46658.1 DUF433 domain-containing protein [Dehalococcoidia bacterium]MDP6662657.1 DUF433 domain-containing protein [SAR202 cluster bacterium]MDP6801419.1 DUF433 domain-containing protein [SAR202 cluster bacterium]|tara:strand:+ start:1508 stop:1789 length:282 start_codon:yes stop_codon:yes gene_type:complete
MVTTTDHKYIVKNETILSGEPIIVDTRTPVRTIVENRRLGYQPEEIPEGLPHLSLAAVYDALSYYCDHPDEINYHIERNRVPPELIDPRSRER